MSEQENSRSPQSSTLEAVAATDGAELPHGSPEPEDNAKVNSGVESDMGNNVFSSTEKGNEEKEMLTRNEQSVSDDSKMNTEGQARKGVCNETHEGLPCPREIMLLDLKESKVPGPSDSGVDGEITQRLNTCTEDRTNDNETENMHKTEAQRTESGIISSDCKLKTGEKDDMLETSSEEKDHKICESAKDLGELCDSENTVTVTDTRKENRVNDCISNKACEEGTLLELDICGSEAATNSGHETGTLSINRDEEKSKLLLLSEHIGDNALSSACQIMHNVPGGGGGGGEGNLAMDSIRDTDSEAGDSVCSEDPDHGEACRGANGCLHQEAEQSWDYIVDEEFNVPRRPVFNGATDHLERRSSLKRKASEDSEDSKPAKCRRGIQFEGVTVFYFPRSQGFTCVPSQGGSSLGMSRRHSHIRQFSLAEYAVEQRRAHREYLMRLRQQRSARERGESSSRGSSSEDSEENSEETSDLSDSELDADSYYFLQPLPIRQRRALLRQAGICHIEGVEKEECKDIRISREMCGCQCKAYCDPDTCQCSQAGIKCQVDRHNFPCGCSREGCGNTYGRIEFNPIRVRTHFIHTLMRLEIEKRQTQQQQQQEWQQQQQQRAKWLASSSTPSNGFNSGGSLASGNLPFFESSREAGGIAVGDVPKFNSSVEMSPCVGAMNTPLYPHFESRQMLGPGTPASVYIQHDSVGDYNSGTCSVFGGLGTPFDPSAPYGSCHTFPSSSVVAPQVVAPQVVTPQVQTQVPPPQPTPEAYNSLSKFTNTTSLVSTSFPYSGAVSPTAVPTAPVNCSYTQNTFCMAGVHDGGTSGTVFGQYQDPNASTQSLFKGSVSECGDFQPSFEAISSSPASADKSGRYIAASSLVGPGKMCSEYSTQATANTCPGLVEGGYKVDSSSSSSMALVAEDTNRPEPQLPAHITTNPPPRSFDASLLGSSNSDSGISPSNEDSSETSENLGEIVKKSMVETVSA